MIVGITGGIGSGKSTLTERLKSVGYSVFNSDLVARDLQNTDPEIRKQIIALFGSDAYVDNVLSRNYIAEIVFKDAVKLKQLNEIVHPAVHIAFENWKREHRFEQLLFVESAILLTTDFKNRVDKIILVTASENTRLKRVCERDGVSEEQVKNRMSNQMPDIEAYKLVDLIIDTDKRQINELSTDILIDYINHFQP